MRLPTLVLLFVPGIVELAAPSLAVAADLTYRAPVADVYVAAPVAAASYDWSGFYAGFNLGYGLGEEDPVDLHAFPDAAGATFGSIAPEGLLGGVQAGFNVQHGSLVFGLEGDFQLSDVSGEASETLSGVTATSATTLDWYGTLRPRIGVSTGPALIYATGGLALGDLNGTIDALGPNGETGQLETSDDVTLGYTVGGGVEYALNDMVSIKGEYQFTHLEAEARGSVADANGVDMGLEPNSWINADIHTIKAGLNFHF